MQFVWGVSLPNVGIYICLSLFFLVLSFVCNKSSALYRSLCFRWSTLSGGSIGTSPTVNGQASGCVSVTAV